MSAGDLNVRLHCQSRGEGDDGFGNIKPDHGDFETRFSTWAGMRAMRGSETVIAARLGGRQPYIVRVYRNSNTRQIKSNWQLVDANDATRVFAVKSPTHDPDGSRAFLEFIVEEGSPA